MNQRPQVSRLMPMTASFSMSYADCCASFLFPLPRECPTNTATAIWQATAGRKIIASIRMPAVNPASALTLSWGSVIVITRTRTKPVCQRKDVPRAGSPIRSRYFPPQRIQRRGGSESCLSNPKGNSAKNRMQAPRVTEMKVDHASPAAP